MPKMSKALSVACVPKIGAHVSTAISLDLAFDRAQKIGAECMQIFISPPQQWTQPQHQETEVNEFIKKAKETGIGPNFIHGAYLINLASQNPSNLEKSISWLIYAQKMVEKLKVVGTIFHIGSSGAGERREALNQVVRSVSQILEVSGDVQLILETSAGAGNTIGDEFFELRQIIKAVGDERVKVCLDTQHIFASGYDIRTRKGLEKVVGEFDKEISLEKLVAVHVNDSKTELASHKDRHENIGEGFLGKEVFRIILNHPSFIHLPFIIETPGFRNTGPDEENINILKSLIQSKPGVST